MVTAGRPTYDEGMRARALSSGPDQGSVPAAPVVVHRRLPRPVVWLLWLLGALLGSVVLGFLAGLARPREPDPWAAVPVEPTAPSPDRASWPDQPAADRPAPQPFVEEGR